MRRHCAPAANLCGMVTRARRGRGLEGWGGGLLGVGACWTRMGEHRVDQLRPQIDMRGVSL
jgi:hypothetical protein